MNNTTRYELTETLRDLLHNRNMDCGEIIGGFDLADDIQRLEFDLHCEFTPAEILKASREAADSFVDSMQENAQYCTHFEDEADRERYIQSLEDMRPHVVRRKAIMEALSHDVQSSRRAFEDVASRYSDDLHGQDGEEEVYEAARSMFDSERDYIRHTDPDRYSEMLRGC